MTKKIEYLVKYSVAPPPSRDYYGLKVLEDEVILYLWRISHGPHKAPIAHRAKLVEFSQEKSLQDEIRRGFGKHLLKYVKNIAEGNINTLLTLPKSVIGIISRYLKFTDIVKLSSLSHIAYEIFNTNSVWQILYKRDKKAKISLEEKERARVYSWKQLYKDRQMQTSIKNQKNLRIPSSIKITNDTKTNKVSMRPTCDAAKLVSKITSSINITTKKRSESSSADFVIIPSSKTMSDSRSSTYTENEKSHPQKKNARNVNSTFDTNEKNVKKEHLVTSKTTARRETKSISKYDKIFDKQQNKPGNSNKIDKTNIKPITSTQESKSTSVISKESVSKNTVGNVKSSSSLTQNSHGKTRSKTKPKSKKKVVATESEIFNTHKALSENSFVVDNNNFDLSDLIEASLKNIRSPRSIFDYDFSCIQQSDATKDASKIRNEIQNVDKQLKPTRSDIITNNFSDKMIRNDEILEKLSEKSEPVKGTSNESLVNDKISSPEKYDKPFTLSEKYMKARAELLKVLDWKQSDPISFENRWDPCSNVDFRNKSLNPKDIVNNDEKFPIARGPLKNSSLLKAYASNSLENRKDLAAKSSKIIQKNQI